MALSTDLISQFVKVTNDDKKTKKDATVYGTIKVENKDTDNEKKYVQLDGSTGQIPITSSTVEVNGDDRVTVMIKNHKAVVTGNLTSPAVEETKMVKTVESEVAKVDELYAKKADVNDLEAEVAKIDELYAKKATVDELYAKKADVEEVYAKKATVDDLEADVAKIDELYAKKTTVNDLEADVAKIDTLMFGSAGGNTIQTEFANSVIQQVGDAQIGDALIESISAGKITAGELNTNQVKIVSDDNSLNIQDGTIQIKDADQNVRVQLGKDGDSNYSIAIYDENGNVVFTEGGFEQPIIRNDMVSDTANIAAHKLDIDSLFEEINDSSNTIKSTKVYLDEEKQTLDVAFKSLTTEVTDQGEIISSQGTAISAIQGQISSKIWQQDIDTATDEMSTKYSTLEQEVDSFKTTVSDTYATKTSLTDTYNRTIHKSGTIDLTGDEYDVDTYYPVVGNVMPYDGYRHVAVNVQLNSGSKPSWSTHDGGFTCNVSVRMKAGGWGTVDANTLGWIDDFTYNFCDKMPAYICQNRNASRPVLYLRGGGRYFVFTDYDASWTIYTEDYTQSNTTFSPTTNPSNSPNLVDNWKTVSRVSTAESSIEQLADRITANVTETTILGTRMSTIEQTADDLSVSLKSLEVGGRNYILSSAVMVDGNASNGITLTTQDDGGVKVVTVSGNGNWHSWYQPNVANSNLSDGDEFTFSVDIKCDEGSTGKPTIYIKSGMGYYTLNGTISTKYTRLYYTGIWNSTNNVQFHFGWNNTVGTFYVRHPKLEKGNRYTDWTPAPEDIENDILDASKTATNYLNFSSSGLVIGDLTSSTLGKNVLIDSDSVDIRNGDTTLASFGADYLYLAKNSRNAKIDLCNGLATMYHESKYSYDTIFIIDTGNTTEIMGLINPLCITSVDDLDQVSIQFANANGVMGGVGIVGSWLRRFGSNMFDTYTILDSGNYDEVMDSGWFYGGAIGDGFSIYANDTQIQYRKIGKIVHIRGAVKPTTDIAGSTTSYTIFTLPEGYRPSAPVYARCQGSSANSWLLSVTAAGAVRFSRYGYGTTYVTATAGTWLPFDVTFFID